MAYTFTRTGAQIEEIHNTVEDPKSNAQFSDDIRTIAGEYRGLWPDTGGSANKGDTYQTQSGGVPTGQYFTALQNTTVEPVGDNINWKVAGTIGQQNISDYTDIVYKASGGNSAVENMIAGVPIATAVGDSVQCENGTIFKRVGNATGGIDDFETLSHVDVRDFGATGDGDDTVSIQSSIDATRDGGRLLVGNHLISDALFIDKTICIQPVGGESKIEQSVWGAPVYIVAPGTSDVRFEGKHHQINNQPRVYPIPTPISSDVRIQAFYDLFASSERILCSGIACRGRVDRLYIQHQVSDGFFTGLTIAGVNSTNIDDSEDVVVDYLHVLNTDWGCLIGGALKSITIGTLVGDNITHISPSDPSHLIYVGPRASGVRYQRVTIGNLLLNSAELSVDGDNTSDAFSIRSCNDAYIGKLSVRGSQFIGNTRDDARLVIDNIYAELTSYTSSSSVVSAVDSGSGSVITINDGYIYHAGGVSGIDDCSLFSATSTASLHVLGGEYINTRGTPGSFVRFGGADLTIGSSVKILWDNNPPSSIENCDGYIMYAYAPVTGALLIDAPKITGNSKVFNYLNASVADNWLVRITPDKIEKTTGPSSIYVSNGIYRVDYTGFGRDAYQVTDGLNRVEISGANTFNINNTVGVNLAAFLRGSSNEEYLFTCSDSITGITHGDYAGGFVTLDGSNVAAGSWNGFKALWVGDRLYETSRW